MFLSTKDVAKELGIHRTAITELARCGFLRCELIGNSFVFDREEIESFIERNKTNPKKG